MITRPRFLLVLLPILLMLASPAGALAVYEVNSLGDQEDEALNGTCKTAVNTCTLRAAIEESNNSTGVVDSITFAATFNGEDADTITVASELPNIDDPVNILGKSCETEAGAGIKGPCAGVLRSGGGSLFVVDADGVKIEGLAIEGAANGITVINESSGFLATNNWVGLNLKGEALGNNTGILLNPGVEETTIGGSEPEEGNVIGGNSFVGLDLEGASKTKILGNWFGVAPNGTTVRANLKDIEITNSVLEPAEAKENEIGQAISLANRATTKCDGGCNVIGGALAKGIDLQGDGSLNNEEPASGPTTIRGNYVGLGGNGVTVVANAEYGVLAGSADNVQVGGTAEGETNNFAGSLYGVYGENGENLQVLSNVFGRDRSGGPTTAPSAAGIFNISSGVTVPARLSYNSMEMSGGVGIEQRFTGAEIVFNDVWGGAANGIVVKGSSVGEGNLIEHNRIRNTTSDGIVIENDSNVVVGNEVLEAEDCGILVRYTGTLPLASGSTENRIGGDEESEENELVANGLAAIRIEDLEGTENEVARNHGKENGGLFIDLVTPEPGLEPNGPNDGIEPPAFSDAKPDGAAGTAEPGATVRVFRKASSEAGELESFLAETVADGSGNWSVTYPASIPAGTIVAATQTNEAGGTSELATTATTAEETGGGGEEEGGGGGSGGGGGNNGGGGSGGGGNGGGNNGGGSTADKTPPDTKIVKGPPAKTHKTTVKFTFTATEGKSTFQCKLDRKPFKPCSSPKKYKKLKPGKHVFKVRAIDKAGNVDQSPAKRKFTVLR